VQSCDGIWRSLLRLLHEIRTGVKDPGCRVAPSNCSKGAPQIRTRLIQAYTGCRFQLIRRLAVDDFSSESTIDTRHFYAIRGVLVQCIIDLQSISLLNLLGVSKTVEIGAA
jgi:hypothetical protein